MGAKRSFQPSTSCYHIYLLADKLRNSIFECKEARALLLLGISQRNMFIQALTAIFKSNKLHSSCKGGHKLNHLWKQAAIIYCNCMMKNVVSEQY